MEIEKLVEIFNQAKSMQPQIEAMSDKQKQLVYTLTLKIAHACKGEDEFVDAVLLHKYPPIKLSQIEAEFLRGGSLPDGINCLTF